jgi:hypothetical protein
MRVLYGEATLRSRQQYPKFLELCEQGLFVGAKVGEACRSGRH